MPEGSRLNSFPGKTRCISGAPLCRNHSLLTEAVVDQQKATIEKKSVEEFRPLLAERFEFVLAGQVQKWIVEKIAIGQHDVVSDRGGSTLVRAISSSISA